MTAQELWERFSREKGIEAEYVTWHFGDSPDELAELVLRGVKTATASAYPLYAVDGDPLPEAGEYSIILNSKEEAVCLIRTTKVYTAPFSAVSAEHARKEGEGDRSLSYWREVHQKIFTQWMDEAGLGFTKDMLVVCEEFELVYKP